MINGDLSDSQLHLNSTHTLSEHTYMNWMYDTLAISNAKSLRLFNFHKLCFAVVSFDFSRNWICIGWLENDITIDRFYGWFSTTMFHLLRSGSPPHTLSSSTFCLHVPYLMCLWNILRFNYTRIYSVQMHAWLSCGECQRFFFLHLFISFASDWKHAQLNKSCGKKTCYRAKATINRWSDDDTPSNLW